MSAVFAHGDLRLFLLHLLEEKPRHGYELIQLIDERFGGTYTPSPGTIYPRLAKLEGEGLVESKRQGRTTSYALTDAGREYMTANAHRVDEMLGTVSASVRSLADDVRESVRASMKTLRADLAAARASEQPPTDRSGAEWAPDTDAEAKFSAATVDRELADLRRSVRGWMRGHDLDEGATAEVVAEVHSAKERLRALITRD
ncbi:MAG: PadR family transcriptional regulator [Agrococcus casei]